MPRFLVILLSLAVSGLQPVVAQDEEAAPTKKSNAEFTSPDGRFAFRYTGDPNPNSENDAVSPTYELIEQKSGKAVMTVVESNDEIGPSARFSMKVLWRPDSKAFAITATLWKRGSTLYVYQRDGSRFKNVELPELIVPDIPEKEKHGKEFPHVVELNAQEARRWQKDGSLLVTIESASDGQGPMITGTRKVLLGFDQAGKAKILKSTVKFETNSEG